MTRVNRGVCGGNGFKRHADVIIANAKTGGEGVRSDCLGLRGPKLIRKAIKTASAHLPVSLHRFHGAVLFNGTKSENKLRTCDKSKIAG